MQQDKYDASYLVRFGAAMSQNRRALLGWAGVAPAPTWLVQAIDLRIVCGHNNLCSI